VVGEYTPFDRAQDVPKPEKGFVNIIVQLIINKLPLTYATTSPQIGFVFKLPALVTPKYAAISQQLAKEGLPNTLKLAARLADGTPLPKWLKFDSETQTFTADAIPDDAPDLQIQLQTLQDGEVIEEVVFTIDAP
jgi:hypothetical protein